MTELPEDMNRVTFYYIDFAMHIWGAVILMGLGGMVPAELFLGPPPVVNNSGSNMIPVLDVAILFVLIFAPGIWIALVQMNLRQFGVGFFGTIVVTIGVFGLIGYSSNSLLGTNLTPEDVALLTYLGVFSSFAIILGVFALLYRNLIYDLPLPLPLPFPSGEQTRVSRRKSSTKSATSELLARLSLFLVSLVIAGATTFFLRMYVATELGSLTAFLAITLLGMFVSGIVNEELLTKILPWVKDKRVE